MMRLFYCPDCDHEILSIIHLKDSVTVRCLECGWRHTFMPPPSEDELGQRIGEVVSRAKEASHDCRL